MDSRRKLAACKGIGATVVKPNYDEAIELLGLENGGRFESRREVVIAFGESILLKPGPRLPPSRWTVTVRWSSKRGVSLTGHTEYTAFRLTPPARATPTLRPFTRPRVRGRHDRAAEMASAAAAVAVDKEGTTGCSQQELLAQVSFDGKYVRDLSGWS